MSFGLSLKGGAVASPLLGSGSLVNRGILFYNGTNFDSNDSWKIEQITGHLVLGTDNTYDIGKSTSERPRAIYAAGLIQAGAGIRIHGSGRSRIMSAGDGRITITNATENGFTRLNFGAESASLPALKVSTTGLQVRLADDSAFSFIQGNLRTAAAAVSETITPTHTLLLQDSNGTSYKVAVVAA